jgi:hypothetical protein
MIFEIGMDVLYGLVGFSVLEGGKHGAKFVKERRPLKKLYPFNRKSQIWIVLSEFKIPRSIIEEKGEFFDKTSPIDGVYSFDDISDYLRRIGLSRKHFDTCFGSDLAATELKNNLILIGGYENNTVSKKMNVSAYREKRHFYLENNMIIEKAEKPENGEGEEPRKPEEPRKWEIVPDENSPERVGTDFCLITKMRNPFYAGAGSWVVAFEGVREFGTWGAVRCWNEAIFKKLGFRVTKSDKLEVVLAIKVNYGSGAPDVSLDEDRNKSCIRAAYLNNRKMK